MRVSFLHAWRSNLRGFFCALWQSRHVHWDSRCIFTSLPCDTNILNCTLYKWVQLGPQNKIILCIFSKPFSIPLAASSSSSSRRHAIEMCFGDSKLFTSGQTCGCIDLI